MVKYMYLEIIRMDNLDFSMKTWTIYTFKLLNYKQIWKNKVLKLELFVVERVIVCLWTRKTREDICAGIMSMDRSETIKKIYPKYLNRGVLSGGNIRSILWMDRVG